MRKGQRVTEADLDFANAIKSAQSLNESVKNPSSQLNRFIASALGVSLLPLVLYAVDRETFRAKLVYFVIGV